MAMDHMYTDALKELEQVKAERDALAAHVRALVDWADSYVGTTGLYEEVEAAWKADTASLGRLIAEKQAEELYAMAEHNLEHADIYAYNGDQKRSEECLRFHDVLKARADELKRESERKGV